jgi:hypothetical protein
MQLTLISAAVASAITGDVVKGVVHTAISTSSSLLEFLRLGYSNDTRLKDYHKKIELLDIPLKLKLLHMWIERENKEDTLKIFSESFSQTITHIEEVQSRIEQKIREHAEKYFSSYRGLYIQEDVEELEHQVLILEKRLYLFKIFV